MGLLFNYYYIILALQAFCFYHAYKRNAEQKWYWIIIFFSILGCIFYLFETFYSKQNVADVKEEFKNVVNSGRKLEKLEKEAHYSNSILNRINLADAYVEYERYDEARELYESCLKGFNSNDPDIISKLVSVNYLLKNYEAAVLRGQSIENDKSFSASTHKIDYAISLHQLGQTAKSKEVFEDMDHRYSNYPHRIAYIKFLRDIGETEKAAQKREVLLGEFERMDTQERKQKRKIIQSVKNL